MKTARVSIGEMKSKNALDDFWEQYRKDFWELFPTAQSSTVFITEPHSIITTTVYPDENSAMAVVEDKNTRIDTYADIITDTFSYEGEVAFTSH